YAFHHSALHPPLLGLLDREPALEFLNPLFELIDLDLILGDLALGELDAMLQARERRARFVELALELGLALDDAHPARALGHELALRLLELAEHVFRRRV